MTTGTHQWGTQPEMFGPRHEHRLGIILSEVRKLPAGVRILDAAIGLGQLALFRDVGMQVEKAAFWGFPIVLAYDTLFLLPMNKRRARREVAQDAALQSVARAGRSRALVGLVRAVFALDWLFSWIPFGPGLL